MQKSCRIYSVKILNFYPLRWNLTSIGTVIQLDTPFLSFPKRMASAPSEAIPIFPYVNLANRPGTLGILVDIVLLGVIGKCASHDG